MYTVRNIILKVNFKVNLELVRKTFRLLLQQREKIFPLNTKLLVGELLWEIQVHLQFSVQSDLFIIIIIIINLLFCYFFFFKMNQLLV